MPERSRSRGGIARERFDPAFFRRPAEIVARDLLGAVIVSRVGGLLTAGRIVETEAYLGLDDPASHAYRGRRHAQNESIYGPPGTWYVYRSYGVHWCANVVCLDEGIGAAVLIRALEPVAGVSVMRRRRGGVGDRGLCAGPGRLCQALGITRVIDGVSALAGRVTLVPGERTTATSTEVTPRVGITRAAEWPLRFVISGSPWHSRAPRRGPS